MNLFDRGFIHDGKAKLVKFFPNKSLDFFAAVDWKKVSAKAFSEEEDAAE